LGEADALLIRQLLQRGGLHGAGKMQV
jgi:hypothetical protein